MIELGSFVRALSAVWLSHKQMLEVKQHLGQPSKWMGDQLGILEKKKKPRPFSPPTVRKWEVNLTCEVHLGHPGVSVIQNSEVVRYWGSANVLYQWEFQSVHQALSVIR